MPRPEALVDLDREVGKEAWLLRQEGHAVADHLVRRQPDDVAAGEEHFTLDGPQESEDRLQERGFSGPVWPEHAGDTAWPGLHRDAVQDVDVALVAGNQRAGLENRLSAAHCPAAHAPM